MARTYTNIKVSFQEEALAFLNKQGVEYDPRYVFA